MRLVRLFGRNTLLSARGNGPSEPAGSRLLAFARGGWNRPFGEAVLRLLLDLTRVDLNGLSAKIKVIDGDCCV